MRNKTNSNTQDARNKQTETADKTTGKAAGRTSDKGGCCGKRTSETKNRG